VIDGVYQIIVGGEAVLAGVMYAGGNSVVGTYAAQ
jgi:hypothetical protein